MRALLLLLALLATPASATQDGWPALHDVVGVAPDDVLNVRAGPGASHPIIGALAPDATGVEVVGPAPEDDAWGVVNVGERAGYVALRYLRRHPDTYWGAPLPIVQCSGTEPFWDVTLADGRMTFRDFGLDRAAGVPLDPPITSPNDRSTQVRTGAADGVRLTLVTRLSDGPRFCSDGMSDRLFGIEGVVLTEGIGGPAAMWSGCCTLRR